MAHDEALISQLFLTLTSSSAAIFSRPDPARLNFASKGHSVHLSLICDNIRDPGNLGTMLRCAAAAGCHNALLTKGRFTVTIRDQINNPVKPSFEFWELCIFFKQVV